MTYQTSDPDPIPVDPESPSAEWVRWASRDRRTPLAALDVGGRPAMAFVSDEVLVDSEDASFVRHLVDEFGAEVIEPPPLPPAPSGMEPAPGVDAAAMPMPTRLRFGAPPPVPAGAATRLRDAYDDTVSVTSEMAAGVLGLVTQWASDGREVGVNVVGRSAALPLLTASEAPGAAGGGDPFAWPAYMGRARVTAAWQFVEACRRLAFVKPLVTVGILDGGFWLNGKVPGVPGGQAASDFGSSAFQLNLMDDRVGAGGASPNKCGSGYTCPWHGNAVASVATAPVGNGLGAAGVGGTVARPVLFKTELTLNQIFQCLRVCLAWGVDVLNMSFSKTSWELVFPTSAWNDAFQFAADNGLLLVAAAGNRTQDLPDDDNPRPATRTPGTITVGSLDAGDHASGFSNYGRSVDVWAPGENLPVMPDPNNPNGSQPSGTSVAAPFVSGILAMMRAVKPALKMPEALDLLKRSGWRGEGRVTVGVDAFAAVLAAMGGALHNDLAERNDTPETAAPLYPVGPGGALVPLGADGAAALSQSNDVDWYRFRVEDFSTFALDLACYPLLGPVRATLVPDDPDSRAEEDMVATFSLGVTHLAGPLAPGDYKLRIDGSMNLYELSVTLRPAPIEPDEFERNDSFEEATAFRLRTPGAPAPAFPAVFVHGPGRYPLTIHHGDRDFFRIQVDPSGALPSVATVRFSGSDAPLDVTVYDADRTVVSRQTGVRAPTLNLLQDVVSFVEVTASHPTRYTMNVQYEIDQAHLPGPNQEVVVVPVPDLGDPAFHLGEEAQHFLVDLTQQRGALNRLVFGAANGAPFQAELLDAAGAVVSTGTPLDDGMHASVAVETGALAAGTYVLRVGRNGNGVDTSGVQLDVERLPSLSGRV